MAQTLYSGPGKVYHEHALGNFTFQAEGENGHVKLAIMEKRTRRANATFGYIRSTLDDQMAELTFTPFDSWALLPVLYPNYLGISTNGGGNAGALVIGTRPHDIAAGAINGSAVTEVWTPDGRLYQVVRSAITQHPSMKLGVGQPLYEGTKITGLLNASDLPGDAGALIAGNAITESGAGDPDQVGFAPDFINGHWTSDAATGWGAIAGFAGMEVEDFWTLSVNAKYSPLAVQKLTRHMKLDSVEVMIKGRLAGPTHSQILGKILAHQLGATLGENAATALKLNGPGGKSITLNDCEVFLENQGFEFGGTKLGTGEVAFVSRTQFSGNAPVKPQPALIFSA